MCVCVVQDCGDKMRASLKCMETGDKDKCEDFIEEYKTCRKEEQVGELDRCRPVLAL